MKRNQYHYQILFSYQQHNGYFVEKRELWIKLVQNVAYCRSVAANQCLRDRLNIILPDNDMLFPDFSLCTDNAAMISYLGQLKYQSNFFKKLDFSVIPNLKLV